MSGNPEEAVTQLAGVIREHGKTAEATPGPAFGNVLYHFGVALEETGDVRGAKQAYRQSYLRFGNRDETPDSRHAYHGQALVKWAEMERRTGSPEHAAKLLIRALKSGEEAVDVMQAEQYAQALEVAAAYREKARAGDAEREALDFVAASALFQLERFRESFEAFSAFV